MVGLGWSGWSGLVPQCIKNHFRGGWSGLVWVGPGWSGLVPQCIKTILGVVGLGWSGLVRVGLGWSELVSVGLGWSNLVASRISGVELRRLRRLLSRPRVYI